jgi:DNA polymerase-4
MAREPAKRRILHVDMDAFFAAVAIQRHPELAGKPLVVGGHGDPSERGVVSTASYEARRFGIRSGMPLRTAYRLCPGALFLPVDYAAYVPISARIKSVLREITARLEDAGIDEAYLDISDCPEPSEILGETVKRRIRSAVDLTCSVGIAPNKLLAKIASDLEKPDGLTILTEADIPTRIFRLLVRRLPGVGPKTEKALGNLGIHTIGELAAAPLGDLITHFGPAHGRYLHEAAQGQDDSPIITHWERKSISRQITFQHDIRDRRLLDEVLSAEIGGLAAELHSEGLTAKTVTVRIRFSDFETHTHEITLPKATDEPQIFLEAAADCLGRFDFRKRVRLLGVRFGHLDKVGGSGLDDGTA